MVFPQLNSKGLTLDRLRTLVQVIEKGTIAAAADGNEVLESQMSRQIKQLQEALQLTLFEKRGRQLLPTEMGRRLAMLSGSFLAAINDLAKQQDALAATLRVVGGESAFEEFVWPIFGRLQQDFGSTHFNFHGVPSRDAIDWIEDRRADLALVRTEELDPARHYSKPLGELPMYLAVKRVCLMKGETLGFQTLERHAIPFLRHGHTMLRWLEELAMQHGFRIQIAVEADSFRQAFELLRAGGVNAGILPRHLAVALPAEHFAVVAFKKELRLSRRISLACDIRAAAIRGGLSQAVDRWAALVTKTR